MSDSNTVLITLLVYKIILIAIGLWASRRSHSTTDFFLGGRQFGSWVAAISASASSSSAWTLLGVSGAAYLWGLSAIWLFPSVLLGFLFNWLWVAPRIRKLSVQEDALTLTSLLVTEPHQPLADTIRKAATLIIAFSFIFYIAAQFKAAGTSFTSVFNIGMPAAIATGALIIMVYTLLGGFWAVSVTDTLQGLLMAAVAIILPVAAVMEVGGLNQLFTQMGTTTIPHYMDLAGANSGIAAIGFAIGLLGIGNGYPGQPHVVNRFMALKDEKSLRHGKVIAITWAVVVYSGMLLLGWATRVLIPVVDNNEDIFFLATNSLFSPVIAGIVIAAVLSAIMSTADSQILVVSSSVAYDLKKRNDERMILRSRVAVIGVCLLAVLLALWVDQSIFNRVLFAWHAIGSAFGPVLIIRLMRRHISNKAVLGSMLTGFALTVLINSQPNLPGDIAERWIPFITALMIAWFGSQKKSESP
ncbi:sodium/proline symporter [Pleionea sp. CnH1-48]|uniref:sodium/proline symporter n=1 Tax=Pleionea sp. CnH1-48 TaxID=2954494 RepID=UPI002096C32D|nr:sodium/proline symporter [Pleionea sp. CnH1-48]MCO7227079.1 sodium/proline symporter [Pleionea sp. CnH1-48]